MSDDNQPPKKMLGTHKCPQCKYTTNNEKLLRKHLIKHGVYACLSCDFECDDADDLGIHASVNHPVLNGSDQFRCTDCRFSAKRDDQLKRHMQKHGMFYCFSCDYLGGNLADLNKHAKEEHSVKDDDSEGDQILYCADCKYSSKRLKLLKRHRHAMHRVYCCPQCNFECASKDDMETHKLCHRKGNRKVDNRSESHQCGQCSYHSKKIQLIRRHMLKHGIYQCEECGHQADDDHELNMHIDAIHKSKPIKSTIDLSDDDAAPTSGPIVCRRCNAECSTEMEYRRHQSEHGVFCCTHCEFIVIDRKEYEEHLKNEHPDSGEEFKCSHCPYKTNQEQLFRRHVHSKHADQPSENTGKFQCRKCSYSSKKKKYVWKHERTHQLYSCYVCDGEDFDSESQFTAHMANEHPDINYSIDEPTFACTIDGCR